jgi:hypothetical protein
VKEKWIILWNISEYLNSWNGIFKINKLFNKYVLKLHQDSKIVNQSICKLFKKVQLAYLKNLNMCSKVVSSWC